MSPAPSFSPHRRADRFRWARRASAMPSAARPCVRPSFRVTPRVDFAIFTAKANPSTARLHRSQFAPRGRTGENNGCRVRHDSVCTYAAGARETAIIRCLTPGEQNCVDFTSTSFPTSQPSKRMAACLIFNPVEDAGVKRARLTGPTRFH